MKVLVIEDEDKVARFIKQGLEEESYEVELAHDGNEASRMLKENDYDIIILDLMLPGKDGYEVLKEYRRRGGNAPVLILTAKDSVDDVVRGFNLGADDYLKKPFSFLELLARIRALLRRARPEPQEVLKAADLELYPLERRVVRGGKEIELTAREFSILELLLRNKGRVLTRSVISEAIWGEKFDISSNVIDVHITYLRKKVDKGFDKKLIKTIRGVGYMIKE